MTSTRILRPLVLALSLAVAAPLAVQAHESGQGGPHKSFHHKQGFGGHRGGGDFTHRLNLTEAQRDKVFELRHAAEPALRAKGKEVHAAQREFRQLAMTEKFDEARATTLSNQVARAEAEQSIMRLRLSNQIFNVLTPEQRQQAIEHRKQRIERVKALAPAARPTAQVQ